MQNPNEPLSSKLHARNKETIFVFLGAHNFWEGLFDTVNIGFIRNLIEYQIIRHSDILMTSIIPGSTSEEQSAKLLAKEEQLREFVQKSGSRIQYYHIQGRTIKGVFTASKEIRGIIKMYDHRFIWAQNYFNALIGVIIKQRTQSLLHFDMRGLVPQEELHYSSSNIFSRLAKFLVLQMLERINLRNADSISTVSKRFKEYLLNKYQQKNLEIKILPNYFDHKRFYFNEELRKHYRQRYQIGNHQKMILYSGMLQKWQDPELLFSFIKHIQDQDINQEFQFIVLTYDQQKAYQFSTKCRIKDLIIESASVDELNGIYNAADIGLAFRDANIASVVASPVKIPEYLATGNSLISLESIGDIGQELKHKPYVLIKQNRNEILTTTLDEIRQLKQPSPTDLQEIIEKFSIQNNLEVIQRIIYQPNK